MNKWKINRAGLFNFWYYDEEIFPFADGKLLLRGANGSGKSVTMQSFLPVLLDGKTSPDRLDPFGSRARRMEDYLLGEKGIVDRDERTGYLFMEFKREATEQYITIGIGLQAKRHKQMKFWGFVITDNRRIGEDIQLYRLENHAGQKQKIPLSRVELTNLIKNGGQVVQTKTEYMKLVNKYLFGFETLEAYEDLIKLLIQLRSPKLSKDFKPSVIYEILEASLPPLTDEDLRHLSDTIEQMDQTKQQIEQLDREANALHHLNKVYQKYNEYVLADYAKEYLQSNHRLKKEEDELQNLHNTKKKLEEEISELELYIRELSVEIDSYKQQESRLKSHKVWDLEKERHEKQKLLEEYQKQVEEKELRLENYRKRENEMILTKDKLEGEIAKRQTVMKDILLDMQHDAEETSFHEFHEINQKDFTRSQDTQFDFSVWSQEANAHFEKLEQIKADLQKFNQYLERYQEKDRELASERQQLEESTHLLQDWERLFEEDKDKKLDEIYRWIDEASWLEIPEETLQDVTRNIHVLYEQANYDQVREPFKRAVMEYERKQGERLAALDYQQNQLEIAIQEKETELEKWRKIKDPELETDPLTEKARIQLKEQGISHIPFYQAVEFQDHVVPEVQKRLEAALLDSGILHALLTEEEIAVTHDRVIRPEPQLFAHTLADFLQPDLPEESTIPKSMIMDVLASITIDESTEAAFSVTPDGRYELGLLKGHALPVEEVRYIGRNARKRFREQQITNLKKEIEELQKHLQEIEIETEKIENLIQIAQSDYNHFPDDQDLKEAFNEIEKVLLRIEHHQKQADRLSTELKNLYQQYSELNQKIIEETRELDLERNLDAYEQAVLIMKGYQKSLDELEKEHIQYVNDWERKEEFKQRIEEIEGDIIEIRGELNVFEDTTAKIKKEVSHIVFLLKQEGAHDIRRQISEVQQALEKAYQDLENKKIEKPQKEKDLDYTIQRIIEKKAQVEFWTKLEDLWRNTLTSELQRGFVKQLKEEGSDELAKEIVKELGPILKEKSRSKLSEDLTKKFYEQQGDLMEYRPNSFAVQLAVPDWGENWKGKDEFPYLEHWHRKATRQIIELDYYGKQVSPFTVENRIKHEQERQESFLDEQDRELYEEILFNTVGQKLRARIRRAELWVEQMKQLMENRDTSSGLSFSIRWKPRTADSEMELDTVDLVHLLRQDSKLLREEDIEKVVGHFRSKIDRAKEMMDEGNEMQTLLQVLKEVLDYRKWFSFVLYFQREGETKRELTNNQFYRFSGGEKAMAMYIPLFTACYSRYLEAQPEAPYIISLDEAFAGVDENNIREMFEIVEQLDFNYIMNSQILWGDYDTVGELAISELIRPKNADCVSVIRYHWDGERLNMEVPEETAETTLS